MERLNCIKKCFFQSADFGEKHAEIKFILLLRGIAALLVVYDHLVGSWLAQNNERWIVYDFISSYLTIPLGIIQDFGWFGVVLFFLISGYIITHVIQREEAVLFY